MENRRGALARRTLLAGGVVVAVTLVAARGRTETLRYHDLVVDDEDRILPWYVPADEAYDHFLRQLWTWLPTVPNGPSSSLPMYYLYCGFRPGSPITADSWENDWGERVPNFVDFARLFYAYSGDRGPLDIARGMVDYALEHGMTPSHYAWPGLAFGTANAGATEIDGANVAWETDDVLLDLAADMGMSFYRMYLAFGTEAYRSAAIGTADTLAGQIQPGSATRSPWPYVVNARTGRTSSSYCSNWAGALTLFDLLVEHGEPNAAAYNAARETLRTWILAYPMRNGNWVDGHSDVHIDGTDNWSNTGKSNMNLYLLDNPAFDPAFSTDVPALLAWTEDNFVRVGTPDGLPGLYHGASVPAEQTAYMYRMGYQAARQAAEYAAWYAASGDETARDRAYRGFNYMTYMMRESGEAADGPTDSVGYWWGDIYGEAARMYFYGFMAVPEWAPPNENHILYSKTVLTQVEYAPTAVRYTPTDASGVEHLRVAFEPTVTVSGLSLSRRSDLDAEGFTVRDLGGGDYALSIRRTHAGEVRVETEPLGPGPDADVPGDPDGGPGEDAGSDGSLDGGLAEDAAPDAAPADGGTGRGMDGGSCSCRTAAGPSTPGLLLALGAALLASTLRRRRRAP